jgi:glycosyltransferase involved in cell wall biosynthesis
MRRVLFVSKAIEPPWNDGSKNLVRDLANHMSAVTPIVMGGERAHDLRSHVEWEQVYTQVSARRRGFSPQLSDNARVMLRLLRHAPEALRHFVFAPNPRSSSVARMIKRLRPRTAVVQTVASAPKVWDPRVFFGDRIVVQSEHSRACLAALGISAQRIWPCALAPQLATEDEVRTFRETHKLGDKPVALYAGDYEVSTGAVTVARAARAISEAGYRVVFSCRKKTANAESAQAACSALHRPEDAVHVGEIPNMSVLLSAASVLIFPVDNLWGKVDLPLVLLEALALGKPLIVAGGGPLSEIPSACVVPPQAPEALSAALLHARSVSAEECQRVYRSHFHPEVAAKAYEHVYAELLSF